MNTLSLVWKNITREWGATLLSILLTSFGIAILIVIYISSDTFEKQLSNNSKNIDLVVGAKGSPMQLILSSLYHVDNPTGNISLAEANKIAENPLINLAVPISLGDNYKGHRIIGTDANYLVLYDLKIREGKIWKQSFEVVLGSEVARKNQLKLGDEIHSAHGLSPDAHTHDNHPFKVVGILEKSNSVVDNLILTNLASVWEVHGIAHHDEHIDEDSHEHEGHNHDEGYIHSQTELKNQEEHNHEHSHTDHDHESHLQQQDTTKQVLISGENELPKQDTNAVQNIKSADQLQNNLVEEELVHEKPNNNAFIKSIGQDMLEDQGVEITALLIKYNSPAAIGIIPRLVNQSTHMQAASPAIESSRIFSLLGVGLDSLEILAFAIMVIAALSVFISLYNALKNRKYDLAIMRTMGASKIKLFTLILVEGSVITLIGGIFGIIIGHLILVFITTQTTQSADFLNALEIYPFEFIILLAAIAIGIIAAMIPAFKAYNTTISKTLASK